MDTSRSFVEDGIIHYTLSLAAVKSGYMIAVPTMVSEGYSEPDGYEVEVEARDDVEVEARDDVEVEAIEDVEVEAIEDVEVEEENAATVSIRLLSTTGSEEESKASEVDTELVEPAYHCADAPPPRPHAFKSVKKKMTKLIGKVKKKGEALSLAASRTKSRSFRSAATFSAVNSSGVSTFGGEDSSGREEDSAEQEERNVVLIAPVVVEEKDIATDDVALSVEAIPTSPTERTSSDIAAKTANKQESFSYSSTHGSEEEKKIRPVPQEDEKEDPQVVPPMANEEQHEVPQKNTSETGGESDDDESVTDDDDNTGMDSNTFNFSKVAKRTYIMHESASVVEESWSKEDRTQGGGGFLGCGMCTPREEWDDDDDFDDFTVETASEEGRVADAVITIQEHAHRLGITEQELLELIQDH
jgi:hypothetical protein